MFFVPTLGSCFFISPSTAYAVPLPPQREARGGRRNTMSFLPIMRLRSNPFFEVSFVLARAMRDASTSMCRFAAIAKGGIGGNFIKSFPT